MPAYRFSPGDVVRVRNVDQRGHVRTPAYIRGLKGTVERVNGAYPNPEHLAYGRPADRVALYLVRFRQAEIWQEYSGKAQDTLALDIYEHWLE